MNIALIGTSPIMIILADKLSKKNDITIFEKSKNYGGAWSLEKYKTELPMEKLMLLFQEIKERKSLL